MGQKRTLLILYRRVSCTRHPGVGRCCYYSGPRPAASFWFLIHSGCFFPSLQKTWTFLRCGQDCYKARGGLLRRCFRCLLERGSPGFAPSLWCWYLSYWRSHFSFYRSGQQLFSLVSWQVLLYCIPRNYHTGSNPTAAAVGGAAPVCHGQLRRTVAAQCDAGHND